MGLSLTHIEATPLGRRLFGRGGLDPYMEEPATSWLVHWNISGHPKPRPRGSGPSITTRP